ncbi:hypothetical protein D9756_003669 [Leucocoprinus leucothites]|uniref:Uncharacterized protein n=1 Tax=Leucocoprinus leucothites TaxID=201217 RepID=A0A8H5G0U2_9AGAR|nr:hypothetical protein D9756_003669 [Leucoagaricus leucothites]
MGSGSRPGCSNTRVNLHTPSQPLRNIHQHKIPPSLVIPETAFDAQETTTTAIKTHSQAAVNLNVPEVVAELGKAEAVTLSVDEPPDVPETSPIMREVEIDEDDNITEDVAI